MRRVITFSRFFQKGHPKVGQPTFFVEKIWENIGLPGKEYSFNLPDEYMNFLRLDSDIIWAKHHTIRAGYRFNVGDTFSPRIWSGKPYRSKQLIIAPDIKIKKIFDFSKDLISDKFYMNGIEILKEKLILIAKNDGLSIDDFKAWFSKSMPIGQIICWNEEIKY